MVLSWLHRSITESISQSIHWMDQALDVWNDLKERFSQGDIFKISDLQDDIYRLHQGDNTVSDYYTQLKVLWDELETLQPTPSCRCIRPCCNVSSEVKKIRERDYSIRFLKGLSDKFSHVRSQIMLIDPLPSVNRVFSLIMQQERQLHLEGHLLTHDSPKIFYNTADQFQGHSQIQGRGRSQIRGRGRSTGRGRSNSFRICTHCGRTGHTTETCFEKHGYPPGYKQRNYAHRTNMALVGDQDETSEFPEVKDTFTKNQFQTIMEMIQQTMHQNPATQHNSNHASNMVQSKAHSAETNDSLSGNCDFQWILDTGAIDHITHTLEFLSSIQKIELISISLPNGSQVYTSISRTVVISDFLQLTNVLFVKEFKVNLI
ncbi:uncharacterized protein LOC133297999 [Gastrolobium bilobum]|uniref:uncharacterized protein LOC133297999 n=1 Tax=Gastrolobium bilobum TaxID=150636 RepID=UPI002AB2134F|nr:uncharacterized protein LOC133297999 [Gastrolobium bilobum]